MTNFNFLGMTKYLSAITCVIRGTSQMAPENHFFLAIGSLSFFPKIKVQWTESTKAGLRHSVCDSHKRLGKFIAELTFLSKAN